jgi:O-Antigen ligase
VDHTAAEPGDGWSRPSETRQPGSAGARILSLLLGLGALGVVLAGVPSELFDLDRHSVPKELVVHCVALLALPFVLSGLRRVEAGVTAALIAVFTAWSALSFLFAVNHWIAFRAFGLSYAGLILFLAARRVRKDVGAAPLVTALGVAAAIAALIGAAQAWGLDLPWLAQERAPGGTFGNRNFLAHLIAIALPALGFTVIRARKHGSRLALAGIAFCADTIVLTRSRAAWLAVAASAATAVFAIFVMRREMRPPRHALTRIALAFFAGALAAIVLPNTLDWRSDSPYAETLQRITDYRSGSGRGRLIQYGNSLRLVAHDPLFGTGPGNWFVEYPLVTTPSDPSFATADPIPTNPWPSSDTIALVVERGTIGLAIALCIGVSILIATGFRLRAPSPPTGIAAPRGSPALDALESATLLSVLAATVVAGAFDAVLLNAAPLFFVAVSAGALAPDTRPIIGFSTSRSLRTGVQVAAVLLVAALVANSAVELRSIRITAKSQSRTTVERALQLDPGNYRLQLLLARNGPCRSRLPHARAAARLLPNHDAPRRALQACGES